LPCYNQFGFSAAASNLIAWVVAVMFAFLTNKPFVFQSNDWSAKTVFPELWKFLTCRICSGLMETVIILITVDILSWNGNWMKLATNVLVIIVNYIGSKLIVFRKKGK
jgi:putative flippase GtrA